MTEFENQDSAKRLIPRCRLYTSYLWLKIPTFAPSDDLSSFPNRRLEGKMRYLFFIAIAIAMVGAERRFVDVGDDDNKRKLRRETSGFLFPDDMVFWDRILSDDMSVSTSMSMPVSTPSESTPSDPTPPEPTPSETAMPAEPTSSDTSMPSEPTSSEPTP
jgi:hypothetical protein